MNREQSRAHSSALGDALHLLTLWSFAVAQPVFDVLRRNGEFFVAHRVEPRDLIVLVLAVSILLPLPLLLVTAIARSLSVRTGRVVHLVWVAAMAAAVTSGVLAWRTTLPPGIHFAVISLAGTVTAWMYAAAAPVRLFVTVLTPAIVLFPALFLLHPDMTSFVRPDDPTERAAISLPEQSPPIVMVVFDQLPLTSLMNETGDIDRLNFPGFAALARESTWYRNATTVADFTGWALPPILSGQPPVRGRLPIAPHYPNNLFTLLAGRYRFEAFEPITRLCPERLCASDRDSLPSRMRLMLLDLSVVSLHVLLPGELRASLPALTENWRDFARGQGWLKRWARARDTDRTLSPREFIAGISRSDPQPTLYFLHALLPHEPYVYFQSGQRFTTRRRLPGLLGRGNWTNEELPVVEGYRLHLLQLGYVDRLVSTLIERLESEGLFDRAFVVVTSDHGASFRPGLPFKVVREQTLGDIMPVPLFIKTPGQRNGAVSDRNVETIDILPAIADSLRVRLPPSVTGTSPSGPTPERTTKTIYRFAATRRLTIDARSLAELRAATVARKFGLFGRGMNPLWLPAVSNGRELIGRPVADLVSGNSVSLRVLVDDARQFREVDPSGPIVPSLISGRVIDRTGKAARADLAIAIGGLVRATTSTYTSLNGGLAGSWAAVVDPRSFRPGRNQVEVHVLHRRGNDVRLERAYTSSDRPDSLNLVSRAATEYWAVSLSGFFSLDAPPLTNGDAEIVVPLDGSVRPRSLRIGLAELPEAPGPIRLTINDCLLYEGPVSDRSWHRTFSLGGCPSSTLQRPEARIRLTSPTETRNVAGKPQQVGVRVENVSLLAQDWPIVSDTRERRAAIRLLDAAVPRERGTVVGAELVNVGEAVLLSPEDSAGNGIHLELRWHVEGAPRAGGIQRLRLPRTVYPNERLTVEIPLMPPPEVEIRGPWDLHVVPVGRDGRPVTLESPCVVRVKPTSGGASRSSAETTGRGRPEAARRMAGMWDRENVSRWPRWAL